VSVTRFCELTGVPRATWYRWRSASASGKGPWATPAQDVVEADAKALAAAWEGWGHRNLAELKRIGIDDVAAGAVSDSTMYRVLSRNGLCLPANYTAAVRRAAAVRREAFVCPHPHPPARPVDQRRRRTLLRRHRIRAPLPPRRCQRPRTRREGRRLPDDLQHDPTPPSHRHGPAPRPLPSNPDHPTPKPRKCLRFLTRDTCTTGPSPALSEYMRPAVVGSSRRR